MLKLYFDLIGPQQDEWVWELVDDERVISQSKGSFPYYLHALADARANGCREQPSFRPVKHATQPAGAKSIAICRAAEMLDKAMSRS